MLIFTTTTLRTLPIKPHHLLPLISHFTHFTHKPLNPINQISTLINTNPNWHLNPHLKSLTSHLSPESACKIISLNHTDTQLCFRFFKWVSIHSTYCYTLTSRIHLLKLLLHCNLFGVLHKAIVVVLKDGCSSVNDALRVVNVVNQMRDYGFGIGYPCYSVLLMCLSKLQMGLSAFSVYTRMVDDGFELGVIDYATMVNALCKNGFVRAAETFVSRVVKVGFDVDVRILTSLVLGYCRIGDVERARQVFDEMSRPDGCGANEVTFTVLIHGLCEAGKVTEAYELKERMGVKGCRPTTRTYTVLIKAVCDMGLTDKAMCLLDEMVDNGSEPNTHTFTILIDALCREGKINEANGMFRKMIKDGLTPNTVTFNALINGYCKQEMVVCAFELLSMMEKSNCKPNIRTYNELIEGLCRIGKPYKAMILLRKMIDNDLWPERLTYNILIDGFCKEGQINIGFRLLKLVDSMHFVSDQFAYTTVIDWLCKEGNLDQANGLLGLMFKKGIHPDEVTVTSLIDGYCKNGRIEDAVTVLDTIVGSKTLTLTGPHVFNSLIDAFIKCTKFGLANAMLGKMLKGCVTPSVVTYTILIEGFCETGDINQSLEVFELMKRCNCAPNVYTFTVLVNGFCQTGRFEESLKLYKIMRDSGVPPNVVTYTILIKAYVKSGDLERGFKILNDMMKNKCRPNFETFSALLEGLVVFKNVKDGSLTVLKKLGSSHIVEFLQKAKKFGVADSDVYSFLIMGLYKVGRVVEGDELVQEMVKNGYFPDIIACSYIMEYLCKQGKYDDCVVWMKLMFDHGLMPSFRLYCCLVQGFQKEGRSVELQDLIYDYLSKVGVEDRDGMSTTYMDFLVNCDEHDECFEVLREIEKLSDQERPVI
ncbi:uncharacterized protein LOC143542305 [Bidens hawaiensis]|uniref:uncharacterized protein LOC143542305 n=1 Tax=Bidens hawaiensis TaxID=980011 RepID=UPI00404B6455